MSDRVTILDVAERAGVAISSVSTALNGRGGVSEATRERIEQAARDLGYVPSLRGKSLSARRAFAMGLAVQRDPDVLESDPFFGAFIGGVESVLTPRGYALVLQVGADRQQTLQRYRRLADDRRVDGVFLNEVEVDDPRVPLLQQLGLPVVAVNPDPGFPFPSVRQHGHAAITALVDRLVALGHRRIGHLAGPAPAVHARRREAAWRAALDAHGLAPAAVETGDFTFEGGRDAARRMLRSPAAPTAIFCANDLMAVGAASAAQDLGIAVPDDLSIAGFDGIPLGDYVRPTLTTIRTSARLVGVAAAELLLAVVEGEPAADREIEDAVLVERESIGPAPRG